MDVVRRLRDQFGETFLNRYPLPEIETYCAEALREYSRQTSCFIESFLLTPNANGILQLPPKVIRAVEVYDSNGSKLEFTSFRNMISKYGGGWFEETAREPLSVVSDFDSSNAIRLVPIPQDRTKTFTVVCVVDTGEDTRLIEDSCVEYVQAMLLLRDYDTSAMTHYLRFESLARRIGNSTDLTGRRQTGVFF